MNFNWELQALFTLHGLLMLVVLSLLELVLGVDNIIFISLIIARIPQEKRLQIRMVSLGIAFVMRLVMLYCIVLLSQITITVFTIENFKVSIRDIILINGGIYLLLHSFKEIQWFLKLKKINTTPPPGVAVGGNRPKAGFTSTILVIIMLDMLFSFDSIFTAIGLVSNFIIIAFAIGIGVIAMVFLTGKTSQFIEKYPSFKLMALCFMMGIGLILITRGLHAEVSNLYLYAALAGTLILEFIYSQTRVKKRG